MQIHNNEPNRTYLEKETDEFFRKHIPKEIITQDLVDKWFINGDVEGAQGTTNEMLIAGHIHDVEKLGGRHAKGSLSQNNLAIDRRAKNNSILPMIGNEEKKVYPKSMAQMETTEVTGNWVPKENKYDEAGNKTPRRQSVVSTTSKASYVRKSTNAEFIRNMDRRKSNAGQKRPNKSSFISVGNSEDFRAIGVPK